MLYVTPDLSQWLPDNPWARLIGLIFLVMIGYQGRGFILAFRKDRRLEQKDEVDLLTEVRRIAQQEMAGLREELNRERAERRKLDSRVWQLERTLHEHKIEPPPWTPGEV